CIKSHHLLPPPRISPRAIIVSPSATRPTRIRPAYRPRRRCTAHAPDPAHRACPEAPSPQHVGPRSPCGCDGKTRSYLLEPIAHSVRAEELPALLAGGRAAVTEEYVAWAQNRLVPRESLARPRPQAQDLLQ